MIEGSQCVVVWPWVSRWMQSVIHDGIGSHTKSGILESQICKVDGSGTGSYEGCPEEDVGNAAETTLSTFG